MSLSEARSMAASTASAIATAVDTATTSAHGRLDKTPESPGPSNR